MKGNMKLNLKKRLAPYITGTLAKRIKPYKASNLEAEGKLQIEAALKNIGMEPDELLGNNAEPIKEYPDYPDDNYFEHYDDLDSKDKFLDEHMEGGH